MWMANTQKIFMVCGVVTTEFFILHVRDSKETEKKKVPHVGSHLQWEPIPEVQW